MLPTIAATAATPMMPSTSSRRGVGMRTKETSPIINGATVMIPIASDMNQCRQVIRAGTSGLWSSLYATAPPTPEMVVPTTAAPKKAAT